MGHFVVRPLVLGPLLVGPLVFGPLLTGPLVPPLAGELSQAQPGAGLEDQHDPPTRPHQPKLGGPLPQPALTGASLLSHRELDWGSLLHPQPVLSGAWLV